MLPAVLAGFEPGWMMPDHPDDLESPISYEQLTDFLNQAGKYHHIDVQIVGQSAEHRNLILVKLQRGQRKHPVKIFLFGQQHGNEPAGKDALLYLIRDLALHPRKLPKDVILYIIPQVNPDGAEKNIRKNSRGADINRDHILLNEPETRTLHDTFRKIRPHISVDCHEFTRDHHDYARNGWQKWPLIMMDCANNPSFDSAFRQLGLDFIRQMDKEFARKNIPFTQYHVGGPPPDSEQRTSSPEINDARNGFGGYGCLSFIIESGILRSTSNSNNDLGKRIEAYLSIFHKLIHDRQLKKSVKFTTETAQASELPAYIPTNYFWGNSGSRITHVKVTDQYSGETQSIPTANFMHDLIVKSSVRRPDAYLIPERSAEVFQELLDRHGFEYQILTAHQEMLAETCRLHRIESEWDPVYSRYGGRQIVSRDSLKIHETAPGDILVTLDQPGSRILILILEPCMMYGLYQTPEFQSHVRPEGILPVLRVFHPSPKNPP